MPSPGPSAAPDVSMAYEQSMLPTLVRCERTRKLALVAGGFGLVVGALLIVGEIWFLHFLALPVGVATGFVVFRLAAEPLRLSMRVARTTILAAVAADAGLTYSRLANDPREFVGFFSVKLVPALEGASLRDVFRGKRNGYGFSFCLARIVHYRGRSSEIEFEGPLIRVATQRRLASTTVIMRKLGWVNASDRPAGMHEVGLEDRTFDELFAAFGSDQVEARAVLTPSVMERLSDMQRSYGATSLGCAYADREVLVAVDWGERFDIGGMFSTLVDPSRVERVKRDLRQVLAIIDGFQGA